MAFLNAWAASCRGEAHEFPGLNLDLANNFPAQEFPDTHSLRELMSDEKNIVTKRFVFDKEKLEALKQAATSPSGSNVRRWHRSTDHYAPRQRRNP
ncbi:UNVERIFIED_CONTAM: Vinorine synthase [Sesamum radiatum]|uniref:Vinorine synthase n=1 Tax=Sesamum radiatum TaxID=300843 RepID=A0AAW2NS67_SESRA